MHSYMSILLLAILQGIAEFLPISSSGHLLFARHLLDFTQPGICVETMLHFGTLLAVCLYYRHRLIELFVGVIRRDALAWLYVGNLLLASLPIVGIYFIFNEQLKPVSENPRFAAAMLIITGFTLLSLRLRRKCSPVATEAAPPDDSPLCAWRALLIGLAQSVAILPGISRLGSTIVAARHLGLAPARATEFSFLMSIPPLLGATLLKLLEHGSSPEPQLAGSILAAGTIVAAVVGYAAITCLMRVLNGGHFWKFGIYCLLLGSGLLIWGI